MIVHYLVCSLSGLKPRAALHLDGRKVSASAIDLYMLCRVSDTMAGACLGVFMVSVAANICKALRA